MKTLLIAALALTMALAAPASANDFVSGTRAYKGGAFALAITYWKPLAERGNPAAQYNVGRMYYYGQGVEKSVADAYKWFTLAARQGFGKAGIAVATVSRTMTAAQRLEAEFNANLLAAAVRY